MDSNNLPAHMPDLRSRQDETGLIRLQSGGPVANPGVSAPRDPGVLVATCGCGLAYTATQWCELRREGVQRVGDTWPDLDLRTCHCGSTLSCEVENNISRIRRRRLSAWQRWGARKHVADTEECTRVFGWLAAWDAALNELAKGKI